VIDGVTLGVSDASVVGENVGLLQSAIYLEQ
jgi:hypothetical protein